MTTKKGHKSSVLVIEGNVYEMRKTDSWDEVTQHSIDEWIYASTTPKQVMIKAQKPIRTRNHTTDYE